MVFPDSLEQAMDLPSKATVPLAYVNSVGNRFSRPVLDMREAREAGYRLVVDAITPILVEYSGIVAAYSHLKAEGRPLESLTSTTSHRDQIEALRSDEHTSELQSL